MTYAARANRRARGGRPGWRAGLAWLLVLGGLVWAAPSGQALDSRKTLLECARDWWSPSDHGLPNDSVTAIAQDTVGWLWFGTESGLVRYDGVTPKIFNRGNSPGLKSDHVNKLLATPDGSVWIGTHGRGLIRHQAGEFTPVGLGPVATRLYVTFICREENGRIWFGGTNDLFKREVDGRVIGVPVPTNALPLGNSIVARPDGHLWLGTRRDGCLEITPEGRPRWHPLASTPARAAEYAVHVAAGPQTGIFAVTPAGAVYRSQSNSLVQVQPAARNDGWVESVMMDRNEVLWVGTGLGRIKRYRDGQEIMPSQESLFESQSGLAMFEDREGTVWVGTGRKGVCALKESNAALIDVRYALRSSALRCLLQTREGPLWFGTVAGGLGSYHKGRVARVRGTDELADTTIYTLAQTPEDFIWIGTYNNGLYWHATNVLHRLELPGDGPVLDIRCLRVTSDGALWIGTGKEGLYRISAAGLKHLAGTGALLPGHVRRFTTADGLGSNEIRHLYEDSKNRLWISTQEKGLFIWADNRLEDWGKRHNLFNFPARCVYEDASGTFWIGTLRHGLYRDRDGVIAHFPLSNANPDETVHGVPDQTVHEILEDDVGNLWLSQDPAVLVLRKSDLERVALKETRHLPYRDVARETPVRFGGCNGGSQPAALRAADGRFWFAARGGALMMDAIGWKTNTLAPNVLIEGVVVDHQTYPPVADSRFPPGSGEVEFHYTALTFTEPGKVQFQHQLKGVDAGWVKAGTHRTVRYPKLRPGQYEFRVRAEYGDQTSNVASMTFQLLPRYYQTWWFATLCVVASGALIWFIHQLRLRVHFEFMSLEQQNALARERSRIAQDLHDDLGANLTEISFLSTLLTRQPEKEAGITHLNRIHRTARHLLQALDEIVWATNPKNDTLDSLLGYVGHFAQEFLGTVNIACRLDLPAQPPALRLSAEQRHNLFLAMKEALNNAAKYSGATEIWIRLSLEPEAIKLSVEDNGQGFVPEAVQGDGNGLLNMSQRLAAIGGRLEIKSAPGQGTSVRLRIPRPPEHS